MWFSAQISNYAKIPWNTQKTPTKHALRHFKKFLRIRFLAEKSGSRLICRIMLKYHETLRKHQLNMFWGSKKVKDFIYKVEFEIRGSCHYLVTAYFSGLKIYPRISVVTLVMFEFNILIMLLRQTSQTNQMWNYTNWSNDSKLIVIVNI